MKNLILFSAILFSGFPNADNSETPPTTVQNRSGINHQTCPEDVDGDYVVTTADLNLVSTKLGTACTCREDVNGDGFVNFSDYSQVQQRLGAHC